MLPTRHSQRQVEMSCRQCHALLPSRRRQCQGGPSSQELPSRRRLSQGSPGSHHSQRQGGPSSRRRHQGSPSSSCSLCQGLPSCRSLLRGRVSRCRNLPQGTHRHHRPCRTENSRMSQGEPPPLVRWRATVLRSDTPPPTLGQGPRVGGGGSRVSGATH